MTSHDNTTHTKTCLFPKTNRTKNFHHGSLQRHCAIQVTIRFYKRDFDYTDIYKMNVVMEKGQELEVTGARFPPQLCCCPAGRTWGGCFTFLGLSLSICKARWGTPGAKSYSWCYLRFSQGDLWMEAHRKFKKPMKAFGGAETTRQRLNSDVDTHLHEGTLWPLV